MKNKIISELSLGLLLLVLLFVLLNPLHWWMTTPFQMMVLALVIIALAVFLLFIWRERPRDEREERQKGISAHLGYMLGAVILIIGIVLQSFSHTLDTWLILALAAMIIGKISSWMLHQ